MVRYSLRDTAFASLVFSFRSFFVLLQGPSLLFRNEHEAFLSVANCVAVLRRKIGYQRKDIRDAL